MQEYNGPNHRNLNLEGQLNFKIRVAPTIYAHPFLLLYDTSRLKLLYYKCRSHSMEMYQH
jgi:hypothetical protein